MFLASKSPEITCPPFFYSLCRAGRQKKFLVAVLFKFFLPSASSFSALGTSASLRPKTLPPSADDGEWSDLSLPTLDFVQKRGKKCGEKRADVRVKLRREGERKKAIKAFGLIPPLLFWVVLFLATPSFFVSEMGGAKNVSPRKKRPRTKRGGGWRRAGPKKSEKMEERFVRGSAKPDRRIANVETSFFSLSRKGPIYRFCQTHH